MFKKDNEQSDDFRKRREEYSIGIRRADREETFNKRRNIGTPSSGFFGQLHEAEHDNIIDERYRKQITEMVNYNYDVNMFKQLSSLLSSSEILENHQGIIGIRKLLASQNNPPIQEFIDAGLIQKAFEYIDQNQYPQLKLQAVWALTNVASGQTEFCAKLVQKGTIQKMTQLLQINQKGVVDQAIWAIGNIAADQTEYRDRALKCGALNSLINIVENSQNKQTFKNGVWAITNLCRGSPHPKYQLIKPSIPILAKSLMSGLITSKQVLSDCCWSLAYMSEGSRPKIQTVMDTGVLPVFYKHVLDTYSGLYIPSLRVIGNFSAGNQLHTEELIKHGIFQLAIKLLDHPKKPIRRETCWILSNLAAGTASQVRKFLNEKDLMTKIMNTFASDPAVQIRRQVCWILANLGHLGQKNVVLNFFIEFQVMRYFVNLLNEDDAITLETTLQCLYKVLLLGSKCVSESNQNLMMKQFLSFNGSPRLQALQLHDSIKVYDKTVKIMTKFFVVDDKQDIL